LYSLLEDGLGVPQVYWVGQLSNTHTVMVMDCLGPSIEDYFNHCQR